MRRKAPPPRPRRVTLGELLEALTRRSTGPGLAKLLGVARTTVWRPLQEAKALGLVTSTRTHEHGHVWELTPEGHAARRGHGQRPACPRCSSTATAQAERRRGRCRSCGHVWRAKGIEHDALALEQRAQLDLFARAVAS